MREPYRLKAKNYGAVYYYDHSGFPLHCRWIQVSIQLILPCINFSYGVKSNQKVFGYSHNICVFVAQVDKSG